MPQEQGVLGVRTCQRWSQGDACLLFPKLPSSNGIIEHKNQYNFYPLIPSKYPPGTCQVSWEKQQPEHFGKWNACANRFFILWDFTLWNCTSKYTEKNLGRSYSIQHSPTTTFYYMFSLKLHPVQRVSTFTFLSEACQWPYWAQNMFYLNSEALIFFLRGIFVVLKNNLNGFRDFYCGTKVGAGSPKVSSCIYVQGPGWTRTHTGTFA